MASKKEKIKRRTDAVERNISRQETHNPDSQTTKTLDLFIIQQTEYVSRTQEKEELQ